MAIKKQIVKRNGRFIINILAKKVKFSDFLKKGLKTVKK